MGGGRSQESYHSGPLPRRDPGTSTLWKIILLLVKVTTSVVLYCH